MGCGGHRHRQTSRRGHNYITVVADLVEHDVINVTPGKDPATVERFARDSPWTNYGICVWSPAT